MLNISNFSKREKALIIVLLILLIGLIYYRFIHITVNEAKERAATQAAELQDQVTVAKARLKKIRNMESEMEGSKLSKMGSYNNSKPETAFLNAVLSATPNYSVTFDEVTRDGNQIRRNFKLRYTTSSYSEAETIMARLTDGEYRCLINEIKCDIKSGESTITATGTFYETMVGGKEDSALPEDSSEKSQS